MNAVSFPHRGTRDGCLRSKGDQSAASRLAKARLHWEEQLHLLDAGNTCNWCGWIRAAIEAGIKSILSVGGSGADIGLQGSVLAIPVGC